MYVAMDTVKVPVAAKPAPRQDFTSLNDLIAGIGFDQLACMVHPEADDPAVALHELESRGIMLWAALDPFLRAYLKAFPTSDLPLTDEEIEERFKVAFDERTMPLTRYLLLNALKGGPRLSLAKLAERRHRPDSAGFRKLQRTMLRTIVCLMRDLLLWDVFVQYRTLRNGKKAIAGYGITAGPALLAFHAQVYAPLRKRQIASFTAKHLNAQE